MKHPLVLLVTAMASALVLSACTQAAPAPAPTAAPAKPAAAAPTSAPAPAAPTAAPAPQPTAAPAAKAVSFPEKGKPINAIVPYAAGGTTDIATRLITSIMEESVGGPIQVVNKPGAGAQTGITELANAKPDGYTIGTTCFPAAITTYLDTDRKAVYTRQSFEPLGQFMDNPSLAFVKADSAFKTLKDVVDAAKANPGKVSVGHTGGIGPSQLGMLMWANSAGVQFGGVQFDGGSPIRTAVLGGHLDVGITITPELVSAVKAGDIRLLGVMDTAETKFMPGVKTFEAQGYSVVSRSPCGLSAPAGTPKEIVTLLANSLKKASTSPTWKSKMDDLYVTMTDPDPQAFSKLWQETETQLKPLVDIAKKEMAK